MKHLVAIRANRAEIGFRIDFPPAFRRGKRKQMMHMNEAAPKFGVDSREIESANHARGSENFDALVPRRLVSFDSADLDDGSGAFDQFTCREFRWPMEMVSFVRLSRRDTTGGEAHQRDGRRYFGNAVNLKEERRNFSPRRPHRFAPADLDTATSKLAENRFIRFSYAI